MGARKGSRIALKLREKNGRRTFFAPLQILDGALDEPVAVLDEGPVFANDAEAIPHVHELEDRQAESLVLREEAGTLFHHELLHR